MRKIYAPLLTLAVLITSCTSVLDNKIESSTIESNVQQIKEKNPELDTLKLEILESLVTFNQGREAYIAELEEKMDDSDYSLEKMIVSEETFNEQIDNLFNYLKAEEISFNKLLSEIDTVNAINNRFDIEAQDIHKPTGRWGRRSSTSERPINKPSSSRGSCPARPPGASACRSRTPDPTLRR